MHHICATYARHTCLMHMALTFKYFVVQGCMNATALNYLSAADISTTCEFPVTGATSM